MVTVAGFPSTFYALLILTGIFLSLALSIFVRKYLVSSQLKKRKHLLSKAGDALLIFSDSGDDGLLGYFDHKADMADLICSIAAPLSSAYLTNIVNLYQKLGFLKKDIRALYRYNLRYKVSALIRLRALKLDLPDQMWARLLKDRNDAFRWSALEYLVSIKGAAALPWIIWYFWEYPASPLGMTKHIFASWLQLAYQDASLILEIFDNRRMLRVILEVLAIYPVYHSQDIIINVLRKYPDPEIIIAGLAAIKVQFSDDSLEFISYFLNHPNPQIRKEAMKCLQEIDIDKSYDFLSQAILDPDYDVRFIAVQIILSSGLAGRALLNEISGEPMHPCYNILMRSQKINIELQKESA